MYINYDEVALAVLRKYSYRKKVIHGQRVANYALKLYELVCENNEFAEEDRIILRYAALLHDIGTFINKKNHHKHSKYLILMDQDLNNFSQQLRTEMALLVSSHRKKLDKNVNTYSKKRNKDFISL